MAKRKQRQRLICIIVSVLGLFILTNHGASRNSVSAHTAIITVQPADLSQAPGSAPPTQGASSLWQDIAETQLQARGTQAERVIIPAKYRLISVDLAMLDSVLSSAGVTGRVSGQQTGSILPLPLPDGQMQNFRVEAYDLMEPALAAKFPDIKTFRGWGIDDPTATVHLDRTPSGFHGLILSASGTIFIDPYRKNDLNTYISYDRRDYRNIWQKQRADSVLESPVNKPSAAQLPPLQDTGSATASARLADTGSLLRTYRLAVAATGEYTAYHGGTIGGAQSAIVTTMNRVNAIYRRDLSVQMTLIDNSSIIYTNAESDPYFNTSGTIMLNQNQTNLDTVIGNANYDIGHVFSTGGGGVAVLGSVCAFGQKARGVTGSPVPEGDPFDVDFVAHEIGHQFDARHTFNASGNGSCTVGNRSSLTAYEPGGGTTIMGYAGICGDQDLQTNSDSYFHSVSLTEIAAFVSNPSAGGSCGSTSATENNAPIVDAGENYTIPKQTPFVLTGSATDAGGQALTYTWEEYDLGSAWSGSNNPPLPNTDTTASRPIFRSLAAQPQGSRTFPTLASILDQTYQNSGESLPNRSRTMEFRLTVRDQQGGVSYDTTQVSVDDTSGPFRLTAPVGAVVWPMASSQIVTWDVADTDDSPVNCANVDILLSDNGGLTFDTVLLANTPNDGSQTIMAPETAVTDARIKIQCSSNIFFDISGSGIAICDPLLIDDHEGPNNWTTTSAQGSNRWERRTDGGYSDNNYWFVDDISSESDSNLESPNVIMTTDDAFLKFVHHYDMEAPTSILIIGYDGGILEINVNNTGWNYVETSHFEVNGYNRTILSTNSALNGQQAFSGDNETYQESIVNLTDLVDPMDTVQFRFRQVNDDTDDDDGWYIDDVLICSNQTGQPVQLSLTKQASAVHIQPGELLTYTLVAKNTGATTAASVILSDTLPANTTLVDGSVDFGSTALLPGSGSLLTWQTGISLTTNQAVTYSIVVMTDPNVDFTTLANTAYVSANDMADPQASNTVTTIVARQLKYLPLLTK